MINKNNKTNNNIEYVDIVDDDGRIIDTQTKEHCHNNTFLLHQVAHVFVLNSRGLLYLQKRSMSKDTQPGKWDTSVGGHISSGEKIEEGMYREMAEELGITGETPKYLYSYIFEGDKERELVHSYKLIYDGVITIQKEEIDEGRFFSFDEIEELLTSGFFTANFELEFEKFKKIEAGQI